VEETSASGGRPALTFEGRTHRANGANPPPLGGAPWDHLAASVDADLGPRVPARRRSWRPCRRNALRTPVAASRLANRALLTSRPRCDDQQTRSPVCRPLRARGSTQHLASPEAAPRQEFRSHGIPCGSRPLAGSSRTAHTSRVAEQRRGPAERWRHPVEYPPLDDRRVGHLDQATLGPPRDAGSGEFGQTHQ